MVHDEGRLLLWMGGVAFALAVLDIQVHTQQPLVVDVVDLLIHHVLAYLTWLTQAVLMLFNVAGSIRRHGLRASRRGILQSVLREADRVRPHC